MSSVGPVSTHSIEQIINVQKPQQNVNNPSTQQQEIKPEDKTPKVAELSPNERIGSRINTTA